MLYAGCYIDVAPSFVFDSVTYVDIDKRTPKFFADVDGIREIIADHHRSQHHRSEHHRSQNHGADDADDADRDQPDVSFVHADYTTELDLPLDHFDLLVSLYAGFISEHCTQHLRVGGTLLVNPSHGDAAMASIDPRYELAGVVIAEDGDYRVDTTDLDRHLIPKKLQSVTIDQLHESNRGIPYTTSPFAYLFTRVS